MIEVAPVAGSHDHIVILLGGSDASFFSPPAHDGSVWCETAFEDLIPADDLPAFAVQVFFHALDKITLQGVLIFQSFGLHPFLATRAHFPLLFRTFISANVDVLAWK